MSAGGVRLSIQWTPEGRSDLRAIDRQVALDILHCIDRFLITRVGDVKKLRPPEIGLRLRCGSYRVFFDADGEDAIHITGVEHRSIAYRRP